MSTKRFSVLNSIYSGQQEFSYSCTEPSKSGLLHKLSDVQMSIC